MISPLEWFCHSTVVVFDKSQNLAFEIIHRSEITAFDDFSNQDAEVGLLLKRKPVTAIAEPDLDEQSVEARMVEYIKHVPRAAKPLGIRVENGTASAEDIARTAQDRLFVKIKEIA